MTRIIALLYCRFIVYDSNHLGQHVSILIYYLPTKGKVMPTVLNVHEAKARFSGVLSEVENNLTIITIMRYGRPVAKIVPVVPKRNLSPLPGFAGKVKMRGDWFGDNSADWENA